MFTHLQAADAMPYPSNVDVPLDEKVKWSVSPRGNYDKDIPLPNSSMTLIAFAVADFFHSIYHVIFQGKKFRV